MPTLPPHRVPGTRSYDLQDGRHLLVGRVIDMTVRIRQILLVANASIFDERQPPLFGDRLRGETALKINNRERALAPDREGLTWVITHVAMRSVNPSAMALELRHRKARHTYSSPWLSDGIQVVQPIDVTVNEPLDVWSGQTAEAVIALKGLLIWSPEAVAAE